jgi:hypothetical protein
MIYRLTTNSLFDTNVIPSGNSVLFFKSVPPVDPSSFVLSFVKDLSEHPTRKRAHAVKRLTPITLIGKATEKGIDELAEKVLAPHFHGEAVEEKKVRHNLIGWYSDFGPECSGHGWPRSQNSAALQSVAE